MKLAMSDIKVLVDEEGSLLLLDPSDNSIKFTSFYIEDLDGLKFKEIRVDIKEK